MEAVYRVVEKDFKALTGETAADLRRRLIEIFTAAETAAAGSFTPTAWVGPELLGDIVATRLASRFAILRMAPPEGVTGDDALLQAAVAGVFPGKTMDANWDQEFLDLEVVSRWRAASGLPPAQRGVPDTATGTAPAESPTEPPPLPDPWSAADMVLVPRGELRIEAGRGRGWQNDGQKATRAAVKAFYLDRTEVPCSAYAEFLVTVKDAKVRERILPADWKFDADGAPMIPEGRAGLPVTGIPYEGAFLFADHHGKRLPSEDEWERAYRGDEHLLYPWGAKWVDGNAVVAPASGAAAVGSHPADRSPFGLLDMAGNVSEVCSTYVDGKPVKGLPKDTEQVVRRGGNFAEKHEDATGDYRYVVGPTAMARSNQVGFRCAMDEREFKRKHGEK
jgi:formylglycine-generating enzyme required for sulfatase activity